MSITRIGASKKYSSNWAQAFGRTKGTRGQTAKSPARKKAATAKKRTRKK